jgi:hypothetical protein
VNFGLGADIEARNARTLDEALKLVPGIHVRTGGDGTPRITSAAFAHVMSCCSSTACRSMRPLTVNSIPIDNGYGHRAQAASRAAQPVREANALA